MGLGLGGDVRGCMAVWFVWVWLFLRGFRNLVLEGVMKREG